MRQSLDNMHIGHIAADLRRTIGKVYFDKEGRKRKVKSITKILKGNLMVRATWHGKPALNKSLETMIVSYGIPNFRERILLKNSLKRTPFPKYKYFFFPLKNK